MLASDFGQKADESLLRKLEQIVWLVRSAIAVREPPTRHVRRSSLIPRNKNWHRKSALQNLRDGVLHEPIFLVSRFRWRRSSGTRGSLWDTG
jgi:hypothetical protein